MTRPNLIGLCPKCEGRGDCLSSRSIPRDAESAVSARRQFKCRECGCAWEQLEIANPD